MKREARDAESGAHNAPAGASRWASAGVLAALWVLALAALTPVLAWGPWFAWAVAIVLAVIGTAAATRALRPARTVLAALAGFGSGLVVWAVGTALGGRTQRWWADPAAMLDEAQLRVIGGSAPLAVGGPLSEIVLAVVLLVASATVFLLVAAELPLFSGAVTALVLLVPAAVTGVSVGWPALLAAVIALAALAWLGTRRPRWQGGIAALLAAAVAVGAMAVTPPTQDRIWNDSLLPSPVSPTVPDVTLALAEDLRGRSSTPAFSFTSSEPGAIRFTLATLSDFSGGQWQPQQEPSPEAASIEETRSPAFLSNATGAADPAPSETFSDRASARLVSVTIDGLLSSWLPLPQSTSRVRPVAAENGFDAQKWLWSESANTAQSDRDVTRRGYQYTAEATPLTAGRLPARVRDGLPAGATALLTDPAADDALAPYLDLPGTLPESVAAAADRVAGDETDRLAVAHALQEWFRGGSFVYDESAPYQPGADPNDPYAVMVQFLDERSGFCVHYAATFAVLARHLGVPTRVAVGYASAAERDATTVVLGRELHAWPEVYVDGLGWVAFEPTPGGAGVVADGDVVTTEATGETPAFDEAGADEPTPAVPEAPEETTTPDPTAAPATQAPASAGSDEPSAVPGLVAALATALLLAAAAAVPALRRGVRRSGRLRAIAHGDRPAGRAWDELRDRITDLSLDVSGPGGSVPARPRAHTPDALLEDWRERGVLEGEAAEAAVRIAAAMSAERYGANAAPAEPGRVRADLDCTLRALQAVSSRTARARAFWLPRSAGRRRSPRPQSVQATQRSR